MHKSPALNIEDNALIAKLFAAYCPQAGFNTRLLDNSAHARTCLQPRQENWQRLKGNRLEAVG